MIRIMHLGKLLPVIFLYAVFSFSASTASAQDGTAVPSDPTPRAEAPATVATATPKAIALPEPTPDVAPQPVAPSPVIATSAPVTTGEPIPVVQTQGVNVPSDSDANSGVYGIFVLAAAIALGGYAVYKVKMQKKNQGKKSEDEKKDDSRCLDLKKQMEKKLKELTDLRGRLESKAKEKVRGKIRESVAGTAAGNLLAQAERLEKEYARFKMLYEQCIAGVSGKKRVFIIHGWDGYPEEGWFPWLKKKLEAQGFKVFVPQMPESGTPRIKAWVPAIAKAVGTADERTYFVGHSMGCQAIVRYLAGLPEKQKVGGAVFVAGFFKRLTDIEDDDEVRDVVREWLETPVDLKKAGSHLPKGAAIFSDNDPYVPLDNQDDFRNRLGCTILVEHAKGHFSGPDDKLTELPVVLEQFVK